jgi:hypothetical protein
MNEIFFLKTAHWELIIRADGIGSRESQLSQTLKSRGKTLPKSSLNLSNAIKVDKMVTLGCETYPPGEAHQTLLLSKPLFYENTLYYFEFVFNEEQRLPKVLHKLQSLCQSFFYDNRYGVQRLSGQINFANQVGWFHLPILPAPMA